MLPLLTGDGQFYILALSQNQVRLFQGTRYSVDEVKLEDLPTSIAEALKYDDPEKSLQFHTGTSGGGNSDDNNEDASIQPRVKCSYIPNQKQTTRN